MSARTLRRAFAAPFVITIACGKSDPEPTKKKTTTPRALRLYEIAMDRTIACVAREVCAPGDSACKPAAPYPFPCKHEGTYQPIDNKRVPVANPPTGPDVEEADLYDYSDTIAKLADGSCRTRPESCTKLDCLGGPTPCPPTEEVKIPTWGWTIVRTGTTCTAQPLPATIASAADPVVDYPCPADANVVGVRAYYGTCQVDNDVGKPPRPYAAGSTWNPPPPIDIECPPGAEFRELKPRQRR